MSSLPPELVGRILSSLDVTTLRSSCFVNKNFCVMSQDFLFFRLSIRATLKTLVAQCTFFLAEENNHLSGRVRELSIYFDSFLDFAGNRELAKLTKLLTKLGSQIYSLRISGKIFDSELGFERSFRWEDLSPTLCTCLYEHIMPSLRILALPDVASVPVSQVLRKSPFLRHIHLGSEDGTISPDLVREISELCFHRDVISLPIGAFEEGDFHSNTELSELIKHSEQNIMPFQLGLLSDGRFSPSLEFLSPFPEFTSKVLYILLGQSLFLRVTLSTVLDPLNLTMFRRLETFSCPMCFPYRPSKWFNWIAKSIQLAIVSHHTSPLPLKKMHFTVTPEEASQRPTGNQAVANELNDLAHNSRLACSLEFSVSISKGHENVLSVCEGLREFFPSWDQTGRLKLWVKY
ncbi:hypothetical protein DL96DRAFT_482198 [Flagelloscypha sp. PMI_526]|nr:hypothetical protein DL96DRAFT_482198 [Flagelloscypha sp. PMI_526]